MAKKKKTKTKRILQNIGHELKKNPPKVLSKFSGAKKESIRTAILLSKARRRGARIKKK